MEVKLHPSWEQQIGGEFKKAYFTELMSFVASEYQTSVVYPPREQIFRAFELCPFDAVKVVILGQDPYHGTGEANGLCFAVNEGVRIPPSLRNIRKEIASDLNVPNSMESGDVSRWATQGVLLLNATLTVRKDEAGLHQKKGWEQFTDAVIKSLSDNRSGLVFMLWGNYAKAKGAHIDRTRHLVLSAAHPSPLSAHNGFFGCRHFSMANEYLSKNGNTPIDWVERIVCTQSAV